MSKIEDLPLFYRRGRGKVMKCTVKGKVIAAMLTATEPMTAMQISELTGQKNTRTALLVLENQGWIKRTPKERDNGSYPHHKWVLSD